MDAKWITVSNGCSGTKLYIFKKNFNLDKCADLFTVKVSADTRYRLYINGKEICHGPCAGGVFKKYFEEAECADALLIGQNTVEVQVLHNADNDLIITMFRRNKPALFFEGVGKTADGDFSVCSDESFEIFEVNGIEYGRRRNIMSSAGPFETVSSETSLEKLETAILGDTNIERGGYSPWGVASKYLLEKRPIPLFFAKEKKELKMLREYIADDGKYNMIFDSETYTTAMVTYEYSAEQGCKLVSYYAECAMTIGDDGKLYKGLRDEPEGIIDSTAFDILTANGENQSHEIFSYRAFRFIRVECDKKPDTFKIFAARYTYDFESAAANGGVGSFASSNPLHTDIWNISRNTLECCAHEVWVDCPFYEQQQYVMDGGLESIFAWSLSNDSSLQKKLLCDMAQSQNADGLISANYPNIDIQIIPGFSLYFIMAVREYLRYTNDIGFARRMTGVCDRILEYFGRTVQKNGLSMPDYGWRYLDWVSTWKHGVPNGANDVPMTAYNLMYAAALNAAAEICDACRRSGLASDYRARWKDTVTSVNNSCFDTKRGLYTDVYKGSEYSQHTAVWAILSGAVSGDEAHTLMERTMDDETVSKCSFSMRYYLLRALEKSDCYEKYADAVLAGWKIMLDNHSTTWCEDAVTCRSECHGWSSAPMYEMSSMILGVKPIENGFRRVLVKPHELGLTHAAGRVPTPRGYIDVEWKREGGVFSLDLKSNVPVMMDIVLPSGRSMSVTTNEISVTE